MLGDNCCIRHTDECQVPTHAFGITALLVIQQLVMVGCNCGYAGDKTAPARLSSLLQVSHLATQRGFSNGFFAASVLDIIQ